MASKNGSRTAAQKEADGALRGYDEDFLSCRDLGHVWRPIGYYRAEGRVWRQLMCDRCECTANDIWETNGERVARRYRHVEGYLIEGHGLISRIDVRRQVLTRVKVYANEDQLMKAVMR